MRTFKDMHNLSLDNYAVAIGTFDGIHQGHRAVINATIKSGLKPAVFTFEFPPSGAKRIMTNSVKMRVLQSFGIETVISPDFDSVRNMSPEEFVGVFAKIGIKHIFCGYNFRFGKGASGDVSVLKALGEKFNIKVTAIEKVDNCSSSIVRSAIENGELKLANVLMTVPFEYDFDVTHGAHIGSEIMNTPTINQLWQDGIVVPKAGVYASKTLVGDEWCKSITNIGITPTVKNNVLRSETHIYDFNGNLYGSSPRVRLFEFIRPERVFESEDALKAQIISDCEKIKNYHY